MPRRTRRGTTWASCRSATTSPRCAPTPAARRLDGFVVTLHKFRQEGEIDGIAQQTAGGPRYEQTFHAVAKIRQRAARNSLIEVSGLEEEETHKEIRPLHHLAPPIHISLATHRHYVQRHHSYDAYAAKQVKSIISLLHSETLILQPERTTRCRHINNVKRAS